MMIFLFNEGFLCYFDSDKLLNDIIIYLDQMKALAPALLILLLFALSAIATADSD